MEYHSVMVGLVGTGAFYLVPTWEMALPFSIGLYEKRHQNPPNPPSHCDGNMEKNT